MPPTVFLTLERFLASDRFTIHQLNAMESAKQLSDYVDEMHAHNIAARIYTSHPLPFTADLITTRTRRISALTAERFVEDLHKHHLLNSQSYLLNDPTYPKISVAWQEILKPLLEREGATNMEEACACMLRILKLAYARHIVSAEFAHRELDFFLMNIK